MRAIFQITLFTILLAGCAAPQPVHVQSESFDVPSTAIIASPQKSLNAYHILAGADSPDFYFGRDEKFIYGSYSLSGLSAFTTYTYDAQRISTPGGVGYQYRWVVQNGVSAPLAP